MNPMTTQSNHNSLWPQSDHKNFTKGKRRVEKEARKMGEMEEEEHLPITSVMPNLEGKPPLNLTNNRGSRNEQE